MGIESEGYVTINLASSGPWNYLEAVEDESFVDFVMKDPEGLNEYLLDSESLLGSKNIASLNSRHTNHCGSGAGWVQSLIIPTRYVR